MKILFGEIDSDGLRKSIKSYKKYKKKKYADTRCIYFHPEIPIK